MKVSDILLPEPNRDWTKINSYTESKMDDDGTTFGSEDLDCVFAGIVIAMIVLVILAIIGA